MVRGRPSALAARASRLAALTLALALAACAGVPAPLPFAPPAPERIAAAHGALALSRWRAEHPRAVLLALHGYGDYGLSTYGTAGPAWAARGIEVYAPDQQGFGRNASNRVWPGTDALIDDAAALAAEIRRRHPGLPLFVAGHSMGGGVALAAAGEGRLRGASGLILLAPAVWGGDTLNPLFRISAWTASQVMPDHRFSNRSAPVPLLPSDNIPMLMEMSKDPLRYANPSPREFMGLIRLMDRAVAAAPSTRVETLTVMGAHDEIIPEYSVRQAFDAIPAAKTYARAEDGWHMLLRDLHAAEVHALVADWILSRAGGKTAALE